MEEWYQRRVLFFFFFFFFLEGFFETVGGNPKKLVGTYGSLVEKKGVPVPLTSVLQPNVGSYADCCAASSGRGLQHAAQPAHAAGCAAAARPTAGLGRTSEY